MLALRTGRQIPAPVSSVAAGNHCPRAPHLGLWRAAIIFINECTVCLWRRRLLRRCLRWKEHKVQQRWPGPLLRRARLDREASAWYRIQLLVVNANMVTTYVRERLEEASESFDGETPCATRRNMNRCRKGTGRARKRQWPTYPFLPLPESKQEKQFRPSITPFRTRCHTPGPVPARMERGSAVRPR